MGLLHDALFIITIDTRRFFQKLCDQILTDNTSESEIKKMTSPNVDTVTYIVQS